MSWWTLKMLNSTLKETKEEKPNLAKQLKAEAKDTKRARIEHEATEMVPIYYKEILEHCKAVAKERGGTSYTFTNHYGSGLLLYNEENVELLSNMLEKDGFRVEYTINRTTSGGHYFKVSWE